MEEGCQINQEIRGKFKRTGDMVHRLPGIINHDERVRGKGFRAVVALVLQARDPGEVELVLVHNEHDFLLHLSYEEALVYVLSALIQ